MTLTARQTDVIGLVARGLTTPQIAYLLDISQPTVKEHRKAVLKNLGARNPAHAVAIAMRERLIVG